MENDDRTSGHVLTRRAAVRLLTAAGCSLLAGRSPLSGQPRPACVVRPEQTEGPFFVDERLNRSDVRPGWVGGKLTPGVPLDLTLVVSRLAEGGCTPMAGVLVDVWHCDHLGAYSGVEDRHKFLRGYQITDARGRARFKTIYPGWYPGRTVHIHFKLRSAPAVRPGFDFTSQLYFEDALTDRVHAQPPYAARGARPVRNNRDGIYRHGGSQLLLSLAPSGPGYAGMFEVALQGT